LKGVHVRKSAVTFPAVNKPAGNLDYAQWREAERIGAIRLLPA